MISNPIQTWTDIRALLDQALCQATLMETAPDPDDRDAATEVYSEACDQLVERLGEMETRGVLKLFTEVLDVTFGRAA